MINQLNIIADPTDSVDGYANIGIGDIEKITNGYVQSIIFTTIDKVEQGHRDAVFLELLKKLCHGGSITIRFLNPEALAQKIKYGSCSGEVFASLVKNMKSCWLEVDFMGLVSGLSGFDLIKHFHEDVYSVATIEKAK